MFILKIFKLTEQVREQCSRHLSVLHLALGTALSHSLLPAAPQSHHHRRPAHVLCRRRASCAAPQTRVTAKSQFLSPRHDTHPVECMIYIHILFDHILSLSRVHPYVRAHHTHHTHTQVEFFSGVSSSLEAVFWVTSTLNQGWHPLHNN